MLTIGLAIPSAGEWIVIAAVPVVLATVLFVIVYGAVRVANRKK